MKTINRKKIIALLQEKKIQDYTFSVVFFLIFSFFVIFAIRPNLITAFTLQKELQDLKLKNRQSEQQILQIVNYQSTIELNRSALPLLDEAIPGTPQLAKVIEDIRKSASDSGMLIKTLNIQKVGYKTKGNQNKLQTFTVTANIETEFSKLATFFDVLMNQRRLKSVDEIEISKAQFTEESESGIDIFNVTFIINSSYL